MRRKRFVVKAVPTKREQVDTWGGPEKATRGTTTSKKNRKKDRKRSTGKGLRKKENRETKKGRSRGSAHGPRPFRISPSSGTQGKEGKEKSVGNGVKPNRERKSKTLRAESRGNKITRKTLNKEKGKMGGWTTAKKRKKKKAKM